MVVCGRGEEERQTVSGYGSKKLKFVTKIKGDVKFD